MTNHLGKRCVLWLVLHLDPQRNSDRLLYNLQVNLKGDEIAQLATDYAPLEIAFFKAIVGHKLRIHSSIWLTVVKQSG